ESRAQCVIPPLQVERRRSDRLADASILQRLRRESARLRSQARFAAQTGDRDRPLARTCASDEGDTGQKSVFALTYVISVTHRCALARGRARRWIVVACLRVAVLSKRESDVSVCELSARCSLPESKLLSVRARRACSALAYGSAAH